MCNVEHFKNAAKLNREYHEVLKTKRGHFRGSFAGVSLISLSTETPELGFSKIDMKDIDKSIEKIDSLQKPARTTREKELQASLIYDLIYGDSPEFWSDLNLHFLTSELRLAIPENCKKLERKNTSSITNDILAIDASAALWIIELKSKRELKELKSQLNDFKSVVESQSEKVQEVIRQLNPDVCWHGKRFRKMIIWPKGASEKTKECLKKNGIVTVGYSRNGNAYKYEVESS